MEIAGNLCDAIFRLAAESAAQKVCTSTASQPKQALLIPLI